MNIPQKLTIASRESALAMWQAEHIQAKLQALYPSCTVDILGMTTQGDQILDKTLSKIADGFARRLCFGGGGRACQPV